MKSGKLSENVLKRSVLKQIQTDRRDEIISGAAVGADCAIFSFPAAAAGTETAAGAKIVPGMETVSAADATGAGVAVCVQESAVWGALDVRRVLHRTVNSLACAGASPVAVLPGLLLPEGWEEDALRQLMGEIQSTCRSLSVCIAGGQTNVSADVPVPHVSVTGIGYGRPERMLRPGGARPGQDIVVSKWIALEGTAVLAAYDAQRLETRYPRRLTQEAASFERYLSVLPEAGIALSMGVSALHDASEGGIFRALWELAESAAVGLQVELKKLPIRQETVEICEFYRINPYELLSGGSLVMAAEDGNALVQALEKAGIPASLVGRITGDHNRVILNEDETRFLERPGADEIYKWKTERERKA